jgi:hypothetical protein
MHCFVVDAAAQTRTRSKQVTMKSKSANHRTLRTPRLRSVCALACIGRSGFFLRVIKLNHP